MKCHIAGPQIYSDGWHTIFRISSALVDLLLENVEALWCPNDMWLLEHPAMQPSQERLCTCLLRLIP